MTTTPKSKSQVRAEQAAATAENERVSKIVEKAIKAARERAEAERTKLVTWEELAELGWRVGRRHTDRLEAAGKFPKRVVLGLAGGRVAWVRSEVVALIDSKLSKRGAKESGHTRSLTAA